MIFKPKFTKGRNSVIKVEGVTVLVFCTLSDHVFILVPSFVKI